MKILIGTTIPPYKSDDVSQSLTWLEGIEALTDDAWENGDDVSLFAALEVDGRGSYVHHRTIQTLRNTGLGYTTWQFLIDDTHDRVTTQTRLHRICAGRNLVTEYALRMNADWVLHLDSDVQPDPRTVSKLRALDWPYVAGEIPEYCLTGPEVVWRPRPSYNGWERSGDNLAYPFPVEQHWTSAGYWLLHRDIYSRVRWGHDNWSNGVTDDPWTNRLIEEVTGFKCLVRKDCVGRHQPLIPMEDRGHDTRLRPVVAP